MRVAESGRVKKHACCLALVLAATGCAPETLQPDATDDGEVATEDDGKSDDGGDVLDNVQGCPFTSPQPRKQAVFAFPEGSPDLTVEPNFVGWSVPQFRARRSGSRYMDSRGTLWRTK